MCHAESGQTNQEKEKEEKEGARIMADYGREEGERRRLAQRDGKGAQRE